MNEKKQMNKKALLGVVAVVLLVAVMGILYSVFREKPVEGSKEITIEVVDNAQKSTIYEVKTDAEYLKQAECWYRVVRSAFWDKENGGFYLYGAENESLILRPKESYDGAIPSGNSLMAWNMVRLAQLTGDESYRCDAESQLKFLTEQAQPYLIGHGMFLLALLDYTAPAPKITAVLAQQEDAERLPLTVSADTAVIVMREPTREYPLKEGKTTFYVCRHHSCLPPVNELREAMQG